MDPCDSPSVILVNREDIPGHGLQTPHLLRSMRSFNLMFLVPHDDYIVIRHQGTGFECYKIT